jgi:hypothetical protein
MGRRLRNSTLEILYNFPNSESSQSSQASRPQASQNTKPADLRALGRPAGLLTSVGVVHAICRSAEGIHRLSAGSPLFIRNMQ